MKTSQIFSRAILVAILGLGSQSIVACDEQGPAEQAGEKVDEAGKDVKRGVEDATD